MSTEIGLKRFDKRSFESGEVERSTSSGKDREFGVTVLAGTGRVLQKTDTQKEVYFVRDYYAMCGKGHPRVKVGFYENPVCNNNNKNKRLTTHYGGFR